MRAVFEVFGILVNLGLALFCVGIAALGLIHGGEMFVPLVPVEPENVATALGVAGLVGVLVCLLAFRRGRLSRLPLLLWSLALVAVLKAAIFRGGYRFDGIESFIEHAWLIAGAAVLFVASLLRYRSARGEGGGRFRPHRSR